MVKRSDFFGDDDDEDETAFEEMSEAELNEEIDSSKDAFIKKDIEEEKAEMHALASNLALMNGELAKRKGEDPTADQYEEKQDKWEKVAQMVLDGEDPTEELTTGSSGDGEQSQVDLTQYREEVPDGGFEQVGGYDDLKDDLTNSTLELLAYREWYQGELNRDLPNGVVFCGPPGTGKTEMAKALTKEMDDAIDEELTFFKVKPNQLKKGVRGESGKEMRALFTAAKNAQPAVIIFEEIDTLIPDRDEQHIQKMGADRDLVGSFLDEITGINEENVTCLGTTNRRGGLDEAAVRDKRLNTKTMGMPDQDAREEIFRIHLGKVPDKYVDWDDIDLKALAMGADNFTGANIASLIDAAVIEWGREYRQGDTQQQAVSQEYLIDQIEEKKNDE